MARQLDVPPVDLRRAAIRGDFPEVYEPIVGRYRVSEAAVASWLASSRVSVRARKAEARTRCAAAVADLEVYAP